MTPEVRATLRGIDRQFDAVRAMPTPTPSSERYRNSIEQVGSGGYLRIAGELYQVVEISRYREKKSSWWELELFGLESGGTRFLEWEKDDEVEVTLNGPPISLRDIGKSADEIEEMSERDEGEIRYGDRVYHYDDDYGAKFHRGDSADGEPVYFYDFETSDERHVLAVEEWGTEADGYDYEVYIGEYLDPDQIEVVVVGTQSGGTKNNSNGAGEGISG